MTANFTLYQYLDKFIPAGKFRHLYIGTANFIKGMGITTSTLGNIMLLSECLSFRRTGGKGGSGVKYFHNVNLPGYLLDYVTVQ